MTRRILAFKNGNRYLISQEFNGDREEMLLRGETDPSCSIRWLQAIKDMGPCLSACSFASSLKVLENKYGYEHVDPTPLSEEQFNACQEEELWLIDETGLPHLHARYGLSIPDAILHDIEALSLPLQTCPCQGVQGNQVGSVQKDGIRIFARDNDGNWFPWFSVIPNYNGQELLFVGACASQADLDKGWMSKENLTNLFRAIYHAAGADETDMEEMADYFTA